MELYQLFTGHVRARPPNLYHIQWLYYIYGYD